ncbi:ring finger domain-containing protein [Ditylenchus destructor]|uniref:Ring finger domain-containing protein n=1 Tax=Ditylenchus destructor TaxID=166010 RepID=A0AAD4MGV1_9BILA|nr:ring finger domain-containing protein [Ditylenchus destructor]
MRQVFFRAFLLVAYCALVIAPTTSGDAPTTSGHVPSTSGHVPSTSGHVPSTSGHAPTTSKIFKVEVHDVIHKIMYKIISFNTPHVSVDDLWNNIYQIPDIARRRSESATNHIYIQLTIITPGQPFIKINNETPTAPITNINVADTVVLLSTESQQSHVLYITKDESPSESEKSIFHFIRNGLPKSKMSGKALVPGKKTIILDFIGSNTPIITSVTIWKEAELRMGHSRRDWSADVSVWHNVDKIRVKACDDNGKVTTDVELKKDSWFSTSLKTENGGIYVDLGDMSQPVGSVSAIQALYRTRRLVEVRIEMIGIENLVITENDLNHTTSPVNFENAIAVVFTVRRALLHELSNNIPPSGLPKEKLENLPKIKATQEMENDECAICLDKFKEKEEHKEKDELKEKEEHKEKDELKEKEEHKEKEKEVTQFPCRHFFHRECAKRSLLTKAECPLCRKNLTNWDFKLPEPKNDEGKA